MDENVSPWSIRPKKIKGFFLKLSLGSHKNFLLLFFEYFNEIKDLKCHAPCLCFIGICDSLLVIEVIES